MRERVVICICIVYYYDYHNLYITVWCTAMPPPTTATLPQGRLGDSRDAVSKMLLRSPNSKKQQQNYDHTRNSSKNIDMSCRKVKTVSLKSLTARPPWPAAGAGGRRQTRGGRGAPRPRRRPGAGRGAERPDPRGRRRRCRRRPGAAAPAAPGSGRPPGRRPHPRRATCRPPAGGLRARAAASSRGRVAARGLIERVAQAHTACVVSWRDAVRGARRGAGVPRSSQSWFGF